jgi:hypothetical protein
VILIRFLRVCIQKFPDRPPGARTAYGTALPLSAVASLFCVSLVSFAAITLCVASQREIPKVSVHFVIDAVRELFDTTLYLYRWNSFCE